MKVVEQATVESSIGARKRCKTIAKRITVKTPETENATKREHHLEFHATWNVTIIVPGDDKTADDESDEKLCII